VFTHPEQARRKAVLGRQEMVQNWDWDRVIEDHWVPAFERLLG